MGKVTCVACSKSCKGQAIRLQDRHFHVKCFKCRECGKSLATGGFYTKDDFHYCIDDYRRLFGVRCYACDKYVEGDVVTALDRTYHEDCFRCTVCERRFEPGDKVTHVGAKRYLCALCSDVDDVPVAVQVRGSQSAPVTPARRDTQQNDSSLDDRDAMSPVLSTAGDVKLRREMNGSVDDSRRGLPNASTSGYKSDASYDRNTNVSRSSYMSDDNVFQDDIRGRRQRLSPIQNIMRYRSVSPGGASQSSKKSKDSTGSSLRDFEYGKHLHRSYIDISSGGGGFKRGPSSNPTRAPNRQHYHRPQSENFSYSKTRKDIRTKSKSPWKVEGKVDRQYMSMLHKMQPYQPIKTQEPIQLSKIPDGKMEENHIAPIDRDDWPAPPNPAAAYPDLLRDRRLKDVTDGDMNKENKVRIEREIQELSKMTDSGAAQVILEDLKKLKTEGVKLDPRSASRAPNAAVEPVHRTRYESSVFASPSRDLDLRERAQSSAENLLFERKYRTTPVPTYYHSDTETAMPPPKNLVRYAEVPRPGYALRKPTRPASTVGDGRHGYSFDGFDARSSSLAWRPQSAIDVLHRSSVYSSDMSVEDMYDPTTGLKRHSRLRAATASTATVSGEMSWPSSNSFRRSVPNLFRAVEEPPPPKVYPYERLRRAGGSKLPVDVNSDSVERHLSRDEFKVVFGMTPEDFYRLAEWKRYDLKKRHNLL